MSSDDAGVTIRPARVEDLDALAPRRIALYADSGDEHDELREELVA